MALADAYATAAEYRARTNKSDTTDDAELDELLTGVSRWIERYCNRVFNLSASEARDFDGSGERWLYVDDVVSITVVAVDEVLDDAYSKSVTASNVVGRPRNADNIGEPYTALWLSDRSVNTELYSWPQGEGNIRVTGVYGWPDAPPNSVREACALIAHEVRDLQESGIAATLQNIDSQVAIAPRIPKMAHDLLSGLVRVESAGFGAI